MTADFGYTYYFDNSDLLQTGFAGVDMQRIELLDGGLQSEVFAFRLLELETANRDSMNLAYYTNTRKLYADLLPSIGSRAGK